MRTQLIIPPANGWKAESLYLVEVSFSKSNVIHNAVFYTGFLEKGQPAGYNELCLYEDKQDIGDVIFMRAVKFLYKLGRRSTKNTGKTISSDETTLDLTPIDCV